MIEQLEVQNKQEQIKNSVTLEKQIDVTNFVKQLDDTKKRGIVDALNTSWKTIIGNIESNLTKSMEDKKINRNDSSDPTVINFTEAINAFETDLKEYSQKAGGNILSDDLITVAKLKNDIIAKKTAIEKTNTEQKTLDLLLITPINEISAKNFFEGDKKIYDMFMTGLSPDWTPIEIKNTEAKNELYDRLEGYIWEKKMKGVTDIKLWKTSDTFGNRFPINNRVITYKDNGKDKSIIQWSNNTMQKLLVQKNEESIKKNINLDRTKETWLDKDKKETTEKDKKVYTETALNAFDDIGNYEGFNTYITTKWPDYVSKNFPNIIAWIKEYEPKGGSIDLEDGNIDGLKNGYANVLNEYIIKNPSLIQTYIKYLTTENLNILWVDKETRTANYNRLFFSDVTNNILRPEINDILSKLGESDKKTLLMQIANIKNMIENKDKLSPTETLSKWLDSLIDAFGPMLFSILKMFGFGKWSLLKMFSGSKDKINEIFGKEYGLSKEAVEAIVDISGNKGDEIDLTKQRSKPPTAKELKKSFGETDEEINTYINKLTDWKDYYQHINVSVLKQWLDQYNRKKEKEININDIVTITTDSTTKKQSITEIKKQDIFQWVMENILKNDAVRTNIAGANIDLQTSRKENKINTDSNEQGAKIDTESTSYGYRINSQQDIARYLTASLFSNKDLSYVMTENELHDPVVTEKGEPSNKTEVVPTSTLRFNGEEALVDKTWEVTTAGWSKAIHELIDMTNPPAKINVKSWTTTIEASLVTIGTIKTYVESSKVNSKDLTIENRIKVTKWDIISLPEKTKTDQEKYTENRNKINGKDGIKKITTTNNVSKYWALDINNFVYSKDQKDEDILAYQSNILMPLETTLTDKIQYPLLTANLSDANKKSTYEWLFTSPKNLANMLSMVDKRDNSTAPKYTDTITNLWKESSTYTMVADKTNNTIIIKDMTWTTENWTITIKNNNGKLTTTRTETAPARATK